ncbi:hypothetical protein JIY74_33205 [Vibrio harveyi]|nr:hypothetical protein [Vibrio harveyi]
MLFSELKEKYEEFKDMDEFDILLRIAYNRPKITRKDRAEKVKKSGLLEKYESKAREVLEKLIDRYKDLGIVEIEDVTTLKLEEFKDIGGAYQIVTKIFGGKQNYHQAIQSLSRQIYSSINI